MKIIKEGKYEIEYNDRYNNGNLVLDCFKLKINDTIFNVDYSEEQDVVIMTSVEEVGENAEYNYKLLNYMEYELNTVCKFILEMKSKGL